MVTILSESRRRRERRQRALARHQWWLVKQNHLKPSKKTLQAWYATLAAHHSRDPRLLKSIKAAMASASNTELVPWKCSCMRLNKKTAEYCGQCGKHWTKVQGLQESQWNKWSQWERWENRPTAQERESSQKARSASRRRKNKGGKGAGKDGSKKGKDAESGQHLHCHRHLRTTSLRRLQLHHGLAKHKCRKHHHSSPRSPHKRCKLPQAQSWWLLSTRLMVPGNKCPQTCESW